MLLGLLPTQMSTCCAGTLAQRYCSATPIECKVATMGQRTPVRAGL